MQTKLVKEKKFEEGSSTKSEEGAMTGKILLGQFLAGGRAGLVPQNLVRVIQSSTVAGRRRR